MKVLNFIKNYQLYSGFPFLLKQTGWLWEYSIDITTLMGNLADVTYIELNDFNDTSFRSTGTPSLPQTNLS